MTTATPVLPPAIHIRAAALQAGTVETAKNLAIAMAAAGVFHQVGTLTDARPSRQADTQIAAVELERQT